MAQNQEEVNNTTFDIYLCLAKAKEPKGPRDLMRAMNISSPGVVHRHLQKLTDWNWVDKDAYGRYMIKKKVNFKGYIWIHKRLIPFSILSATTFVALSTIWIIILLIHLWNNSPIDQSYTILTIVTIIAAAFLVIEAFRPRKKVPKQPIEI